MAFPSVVVQPQAITLCKLPLIFLLHSLSSARERLKRVKNCAPKSLKNVILEACG